MKNIMNKLAIKQFVTRPITYSTRPSAALDDKGLVATQAKPSDGLWLSKHRTPKAVLVLTEVEPQTVV